MAKRKLKLKPKGAHPRARFNDRQIRAITAPGCHADGGGLYLAVSSTGARSWIVEDGRSRAASRGRARQFELVKLGEAREEARRLRRIACDGGDPVAERGKSRPGGIPTFEQAARKVHAEHAASYRNKKHAAQWISTLESRVFPLIGARPINAITRADVLAARCAANRRSD